MDRVSVGEALGNAGFPSRWVLTGGGSAVLRVDVGDRCAAVGPFGEDGRAEDPGWMSVVGYGVTMLDDSIGGDDHRVYEVIAENVGEVAAAVVGFFGTDDVAYWAGYNLARDHAMGAYS